MIPTFREGLFPSSPLFLDNQTSAILILYISEASEAESLKNVVVVLKYW